MNVNLDKELYMNEFNNIKNTILKDYSFNSFIEKNRLTPALIENNLYLVKDCYDSRKLCKGCDGLHECRQAQAGQIIDLINDRGVLFETRANCPYLIKKSDEEAFLSNFSHNDIETPHKLLSFNKLDPRSENVSYQKLFIDLYHSAEVKTGFYVFGEMGIGKSYLLSSYFNDLARNGKKVSYIRCADFMANMIALSRDDKSKFILELNRAKHADVLCLDDIGAETINEFTRDEILYPILDYRMSNELKTFFISNVSINALGERYANTFKKDAVKGNRIIERIKKLAIPYELIGKNKRF